jgi:histone H1/5
MRRPEPASKSERAASTRAKASASLRSKRPDAASGAAKKVKTVIAANSAPPQTVTKHPPTAKMVTAAIADLKERGGSSLQAIKKYIAASYNVNVVKMAPYIRKYLRKAVIDGQLVQTKGRGASGSFKLATSTGKTAAAPKKDKIKTIKTVQAAAAKLAKEEKNVKKARTVAEKQALKVVAKKSAAQKTAKK